eukprot:1567295-Pyramimonas_sp.AAC.1
MCTYVHEWVLTLNPVKRARLSAASLAERAHADDGRRQAAFTDPFICAPLLMLPVARVLMHRPTTS